MIDADGRRRLEQSKTEIELLTDQVAEETAGAQEVLLADSQADPIDAAQAVLDREASQEVLAVLALQREQLERATLRAAEGSYGRCEDCGSVIDPERLRVAPEATRCVPCQARADRSPYGKTL
ncbi:MAG TPA: TraR/DksA family transcriptional regulator [Candidatus Nitrosotalea sp.]|nr:TraR/DksA family transcriptional regulator [Candidatus Nitrosotalea sp.]